MHGQRDRIEDRTRALIRAELRGDGALREICLVDISSRGLLATTARPPARGAIVDITVGRHVLVGEVVWASTRRFGVRLRDRISVIGLVSGDNADIKLAVRRVQNRKTRRHSADTGWIASRLQYAGIIAACAVGAFFVSEYVAQSLGSLETAKTAMAGKSGSTE